MEEWLRGGEEQAQPGSDSLSLPPSPTRSIEAEAHDRPHPLILAWSSSPRNASRDRPSFEDGAAVGTVLDADVAIWESPRALVFPSEEMAEHDDAYEDDVLASDEADDAVIEAERPASSSVLVPRRSDLEVFGVPSPAPSRPASRADTITSLYRSFFEPPRRPGFLRRPDPPAYEPNPPPYQQLSSREHFFFFGNLARRRKPIA